MAGLFGFVQLEFPGTLGLADGRYLARENGEEKQVLVVQSLGAPARHLLRGRKPRAAKANEAAPVPITRVTAIDSAGLDDRAGAERWLERIAKDRDSSEAEVEKAILLLNRAIHAHRAAAGDPTVHEVSPGRASVARLGFGTGDQLADGQWTEACELPPLSPRGRRADDLRPQERIAAVLGGRDEVAAWETLVLRARLDLDQGRPREAALQLRVGLEALLGALGEGGGPQGEAEDVATLSERRGAIGDAANAALAGELSDQQEEAVRETVSIGERILRRRRARAG